MEYIKIPITQQMKDDLDECWEMVDSEEGKDCSGCSMDGGAFGCMADKRWCRERQEAMR